MSIKPEDVPDNMVAAARAAVVAANDGQTEVVEYDIRTAIAAAFECAGISRVQRMARNNVWAPGDEYTTIGDEQVDHLGILPGMYGERWESDWTPVTKEQP